MEPFGFRETGKQASRSPGVEVLEEPAMCGCFPREPPNPLLSGSSFHKQGWRCVDNQANGTVNALCGGGGIRTPDAGVCQHTPLAGELLKPLGHSSAERAFIHRVAQN